MTPAQAIEWFEEQIEFFRGQTFYEGSPNNAKAEAYTAALEALRDTERLKWILEPLNRYASDAAIQAEAKASTTRSPDPQGRPQEPSDSH